MFLKSVIHMYQNSSYCLKIAHILYSLQCIIKSPEYLEFWSQMYRLLYQKYYGIEMLTIFLFANSEKSHRRWPHGVGVGNLLLCVSYALEKNQRSYVHSFADLFYWCSPTQQGEDRDEIFALFQALVQAMFLYLTKWVSGIQSRNLYKDFSQVCCWPLRAGRVHLGKYSQESLLLAHD